MRKERLGALKGNIKNIKGVGSVEIKLKQDIILGKIYDSTFKMTFNHQKSYFLNFDLSIYFLIFKMSLKSPNESP